MTVPTVNGAQTRKVLEAVLRVLENEEVGMSITRIERELRWSGIKINRLVLTGYLQAMTEYGVLEYDIRGQNKLYRPTHTIVSQWKTVGGRNNELKIEYVVPQ